MIRFSPSLPLLLVTLLGTVSFGWSDGVHLENLLRENLESTSGHEVIVSRVKIPPNSSLPKHWHPGEEIGYVLEGTVTLWMKGKESVTLKKGDTMKIPFKQIHTAITSEEGATVLVFRVHIKGEPERVLAE